MGEYRGNVFFTVPNQTGTREDQVIVFLTWTPVNLMEQVTRNQLLSSSSFRKSLSKGMLVCISEEDAQKVLSCSGGNEEAHRVKQLSVGTASAEAQYGVGRESTNVEAAIVAGKVSVPVQQFIDLLEETDDVSATNTYRNLGQISLEENRAVLKAARATGYANLGKLTAANIAEIKRTDEERDSE